MTWLAFVCSVMVVATVDMLADVTHGFLMPESFVIGLDSSSTPLRASFARGDFFFVVFLGACGGIIGATYNRLGFWLARIRTQLFARSSRYQSKILRIAEALAISTLVFSLFFWVPIIAGCQDCPSADTPGCGGKTDAASASGSATHVHHALHERLHGIRYRRWHCPEGQYSELATLLHAGQEEMVKHLLSRGSDPPPPSLSVLVLFLPLYLLIGGLVLGLAVPAGNFIPAMTMGAALGRIAAHLLLSAGVIEDDKDAGRYALVGAAACLGGVTRMTVTIAVILAEVSNDVATLPVCMLCLATARIVGNQLSLSFDHGMIELASVPFLSESPPRVFEVLTAKDVMAPKPIRLLEITTVRDVMFALTNSSHNGFPVVSGSSIKDHIFQSLEPSNETKSSRANLVGLILRRQLLVLLKEKVWESQVLGLQLEDASKERFLSSFYVMAHVDLEAETRKVQRSLSEADLDSPLDLRSFYDPAPFAVNGLAPLSVVYRLFNEIGVRHIPVLSSSQRLIGIITRKDVQPENISHRLSAVEVHTWATDMHSYWRSLLFGGQAERRQSQSEGDAAPMSDASRRISTNPSHILDACSTIQRMSRRVSSLSSLGASSIRRLSNPTSLVLGSRSSRASSSSNGLSATNNTTGTRRRDSTERNPTGRAVDARRGSVNSSSSGSENIQKMRASHAISEAKQIARASSPSAQSDERGSDMSTTFPPAAGEAPSSPRRSISRGLVHNELPHSGLLRNQPSKRDLLANNLLLVSDVLRAGISCPQTPESDMENSESSYKTRSPGVSKPISICNGGEQPSLQESLQAVSSRRLREYPFNSDTILPRAIHRNDFSPSRSPKYMWQVQGKRMVRRDSAPAKLCQDNFSSLHALLEVDAACHA